MNVFEVYYSAKFGFLKYKSGILHGYKMKIHAYVLVPKNFMKFMFSTVYRVTQKDFYARPLLHPLELETGSWVDRAIVLLMDPLGHLRNTSRPLVEV